MNKKLYRKREGAMIAGVCSGLAEYFNCDVNLVRILTVVACCVTGVGLVAYIAAALILPEI